MSKVRQGPNQAQPKAAQSQKSKGKAPRHQNKYSFRHNPNSVKTKLIAHIPNCHVCEKCTIIIEWRKKYRKYKVQKDFSRCNKCLQKNVQFAYHQICAECSKSTNTCAKCLVPRGENDDNTVKISESELETLLKNSLMKEREKKNIMRRWKDEVSTTVETLAYIARVEAMLEIEGVRGKLGEDGLPIKRKDTDTAMSESKSQGGDEEGSGDEFQGEGDLEDEQEYDEEDDDEMGGGDFGGEGDGVGDDDDLGMQQ